ncbi:helix-turn-helix transcriptional regulator [Clostridium sp. D33t1_170424_F3]|uniref:helix-turn-helix transcriptional regulator n=1 Tax=Clostridium sp. D33t1_170424_F3 TaxID=2787099 RepID=UPI0018AB5228|nr:helix-turn-helix transcriptional regulator [Clostridium sp. D33t1_170424_F3]
MEYLRNRIRELREDRDLTQQQLADILHVCQSTYSSYELGIYSIPVQAVVTLASFYQTSTDDLLGVSPASSRRRTLFEQLHK